jgi:hypothetical protein
MVQPALRNKLDQLRDRLLNSTLVEARNFYLFEIDGDPNAGDPAIKAAFLTAEGRSAIDFVDGVLRNFAVRVLQLPGISLGPAGVYLPAYGFVWGIFEVGGRGKGQLFYFLAERQGLVSLEWSTEQPLRQWGFLLTAENRVQWRDDNGPLA